MLNVIHFKFRITEASQLNIKLPQNSESTILLSPIFPPPPDYNNDKASPFFESCKVKIRNNNIYQIEHFKFQIPWIDCIAILVLFPDKDGLSYRRTRPNDNKWSHALADTLCK